MLSIVAIDIETTGLDSVRDAIIEIAAVRFHGDQVDATFDTLINPGRSIPPEITRLTGIRTDDVRFSPRLAEVSAEFESFVGDAVVIGHNVRFDLGFLNQRSILQNVPSMDTYDMAAVLLPGAGRYNLGALAELLQIPLRATHRALDDALVTHQVFARLYQQLLTLPLDLLAEIVRLGEGVEWGGRLAFEMALRDRMRERLPARKAQSHPLGPLFGEKPLRFPPALPPNPEPKPLNVDQVSALLEPGGAFSRQFPQFEYRSEQVDMLRSVAWALSEGQHLMIEAGTGTGKSVAYLLPAAMFAYQNDLRVVISTNTINLQDQLMSKDIPDICEALDLPIRATVLKGRSNYLCPRRLEILRRAGPDRGEEMRVLAKVLVWLSQGGTGDRLELNLNQPVERLVWEKISAADDGCTSDACQERMGGRCPFYKARMAAQSAHLVVVNHALLLADLAVGNRVLPEYSYLVIDEGHHMENAVTSALSFQVTQPELDRIMRDLGGAGAGILGGLLAAVRQLVSPEKYGAFNHMIQSTTDQAFHFQNLSRAFFTAIDDFLLEAREGRQIGPYAQQVRLVNGTRALSSWLEVEVIWDDASRVLKQLADSVEQIATAAGELVESGHEAIEDDYSNITSIYRSLLELLENLDGLVFKPDPDRVYWAEVNSDGRRISLQSAPLHIGPLVQKHLWHEKVSVVLTSATLRTYGDFDYLRNRLFAYEAETVALGSPFDYENQALVYMVKNIPDPSDRAGHQRAVEDGLVQLCIATGGRALVLFTSYAQLQQTSRAIAPALSRAGIVIYEQGSGASAHTLLENFKSTEQAVLMGTRAFWEGVDIPGEALSVLAIVKLPFAVPSDPIVAARSETFEDSFNEYSLPEAILTFRQGFGRLIRTKYDRGIVVIFDKRVLTKTYGKAFVDSLPECTFKAGLLQDLPSVAAQWLNM